LQSQSRTSTTFSLEGELIKLKVPIPLSELMRKKCLQIIGDQGIEH